MCQMRLSEEAPEGVETKTLVVGPETPFEGTSVDGEWVDERPSGRGDPQTFVDGSVSFTWEEWEGGLCAKAEAALEDLYDEMHPKEEAPKPRGPFTVEELQEAIETLPDAPEPSWANEMVLTSDGQEVPAVVVFDEGDFRLVEVPPMIPKDCGETLSLT